MYYIDQFLLYLALLFYKLNQLESYVYNAIFNRIRARRFKNYEKRVRHESKFSTLSLHDVLEKSDVESFCLPSKHGSIDFDLSHEINRVAKTCKLTEKEKDMLLCFTSRFENKKHWYKEFSLRHTISCKRTIRNELRRLQTKVFYGMKNSGLLPTDFVMPRMKDKIN